MYTIHIYVNGNVGVLFLIIRECRCCVRALGLLSTKCYPFRVGDIKRSLHCLIQLRLEYATCVWCIYYKTCTSSEIYTHSCFTFIACNNTSFFESNKKKHIQKIRDYFNVIHLVYLIYKFFSVCIYFLYTNIYM